MYLLFIIAFIVIGPFYPEHPVHFIEWVLWFFNGGYILHEFLEIRAEKWNYLSITNVFDAIISVIWVVLLIVRIHSSLVGEVDENGLRISPYAENGDHWFMSKAYTTLWAIQLVFLCLRSLAIFEHTKYFGILWKIIALMMGQIIRFCYFMVVVLIGFLFGVYF
eukprot:262518_1